MIKKAYEVRHFGPCKGAKLSDLMNQFPEAEFAEDFKPNGWHYAGNENQLMAIQRASEIIKQVKMYPEDAKIAMFTHGILNQYLIRDLLGLTNAPHIHLRELSVAWY